MNNPKSTQFEIETQGCLMCGKCCGVIPIFASEIAVIDKYIHEHKIKPESDRTLTCPFLSAIACDPFRYCRIHAVRPRMCQVFPHSVIMPCPNGAGPKYPEPIIKAFLFRDKERAQTTLNQHYASLKIN